jgi:hypothetical protein
MNDQVYTQMLKDVTTEVNFEKACEMLTQIHQECDCRTTEYYGGKRTQRSIKSRAFVCAANTVRWNFHKFVTMSKNGRYEVNERNQRIQDRQGW